MPELVHSTFERLLLLLNFQSKFCCENFRNYYRYYKVIQNDIFYIYDFNGCPQEKPNEKLLFELFMLQIK
jgi:hypothetical protein